jgi:hypothetical protein
VLASQDSIQKALQDFQNPDVEAPQKATAAALNLKPKTKAPPPKQTYAYVLNGNGAPGAAANASYALAQRGYRMLTSSWPANAPRQDFYKTTIYYAKGDEKAQAAAKPMSNLFAPAEIAPMTLAIRKLSPQGTMLTVVVGQTFHGDIAPAPVDKTPQHEPANVRYDPDQAAASVKEREPRVPYTLMVPYVVERSSRLSSMNGARLYYVEGKHKALRLTYVTGANEYWGVQETDWADAPALAKPSETRKIKGRTYDLYFSGSHLHMIVLRGEGDTRYWVVNTLLDSLSNETMIAIAKGLKPAKK